MEIQKSCQTGLLRPQTTAETGQAEVTHGADAAVQGSLEVLTKDAATVPKLSPGTVH